MLGGGADNDKLGSVDPTQMAAVTVDPEIKAVRAPAQKIAVLHPLSWTLIRQ